MSHTEHNEDHIYCQNCQTPLMLHAKFCHKCGQKPISGKVTIHELLHEFLHIWMHIEGKLLATLRHLFVPGKLTQDFFKGFHVRYAHPVQLFFILGVLCFEAMECSSKKVEEDSKHFTEKINENNYRHLFMEQMDSAKTITLEQFKGTPFSSTVMDSFSNHLKQLTIDEEEEKEKEKEEKAEKNIEGKLKKKKVGVANVTIDSVQKNRSLVQFDFTIDKKDTSDEFVNFWLLPNIKRSDLVKLTSDQIIEKYKVEGFWRRLYAKQMLKVNKEGGDLLHFIMGKAFWGFAFIVPCLALLFKLLYRKRYFVEHVVFWLHYHAFLFVTIMLMVLLSHWESNIVVAILVNIVFLCPFVYLFIAMRRYYQQGFGKTLFKYGIMSVAYFVLFIISIVGNVAINFLLF